MKTLNCDVCKHPISAPVVGRNYFHLAHRDICEPCKDTLEGIIRPVIRTREPFNYEWYNHFVQDTIEKGIVKGKF